MCLTASIERGFKLRLAVLTVIANDAAPTLLFVAASRFTT
jgi:hypothetical protein